MNGASPLISRLLSRHPEPSSIFEHIQAHVRPGVAGLSDGGDKLPDEKEFWKGEMPFAPGALEGIFCGPGKPDEVRAAVDRISAALSALAEKPDAGTRLGLCHAFREGHVRSRIDALWTRLADAPPPNYDELYPELRQIFLRSGHRDEVKYAMDLLSGWRRRDDADLFRVVGRHEEFTLYAGIALIRVTDDPMSEWLALLSHVSGWGRTELSSLILRADSSSQRVRERLVSGGLGVGNALTLATDCRLDEILARPAIADDLLAGARDILDELVNGWGPPTRLADYEQAGAAAEALLAHLATRTRDAETRRVVRDLQDYLSADEHRYDAGTREDRFAACGLDEGRLVRLHSACAEYLAS